MKRFSFTFVIVIAALSLSGCADFKRKHARQPVDEGFVTWNLVVDGLPVEDLLDQGNEEGRAAFEEVLARLEGEGVPVDDPEQLRALLNSIEEGDAEKSDYRSSDLPGTLRGFAAISTAQFLRTAILGESEEIRGKITRYYYNDYTSGGYLEVKTIVTRFDATGAPIAKNRYFWAISIRPDTFTVHKRNDADPDDVFPGTLPIPLSHVKERGLNHKLYATGEKEGIVVLGVYRNGTLLPQWHPYYDMNAKSCIDLLFKGYPPEDELPEQRFYCLGRCASPPIVNTY